MLGMPPCCVWWCGQCAKRTWSGFIIESRLVPFLQKVDASLVMRLTNSEVPAKNELFCNTAWLCCIFACICVWFVCWFCQVLVFFHIPLSPIALASLCIILWLVRSVQGRPVYGYKMRCVLKRMFNQEQLQHGICCVLVVFGSECNAVIWDQPVAHARSKSIASSEARIDGGNWVFNNLTTAVRGNPLDFLFLLSAMNHQDKAIFSRSHAIPSIPLFLSWQAPLYWNWSF